MLSGDFTPHSAVNVFLKDLGIVLDLARELNFPVPMAALAHQPFLMAAASVERHLRVDQNRGRNQLNLFKKGPFVSNSMKRFALSQKAGDFQG